MKERTVTEEQIGQLNRRQNKIYRLVREESLDFETVMTSLQSIIECDLVRPWTVEDGLFYVTVISDGTTGEGWIARLERQGFHLNDDAKYLLRSEEFIPTNDVTYRVAVLLGTFFIDDNRMTGVIRAHAKGRGLEDSTPEVTCLLREALSDDDLKAMGLVWLVVMHKPIKNSNGIPCLLDLSCASAGPRLVACSDMPFDGWGRVGAFAFVAPQASSDPYR